MNKFYFCSICQQSYAAHEFIEEINRWHGLRVFRLLCRHCIREFVKWDNHTQRAYLQLRLEDHFGEDQYVYALCHPLTDEIHYVGRSNKPRQRYTRHLAGLTELTKEICPLSEKVKIKCECEVHSTRNTINSSRYWIADLTLKNLKPTLRILEKVAPSFRIPEREMRWIAHLIQNQARLVNTENQCSKIVELVRREKQSLLEIPLKQLIGNGFTTEYHRLLSHLNKYSGWQHAGFINSLNEDWTFKDFR